MNKWMFSTFALLAVLVVLGAYSAYAVEIRPGLDVFSTQNKCDGLKPPASSCSATGQNGDHKCIQGGGGACDWVCICNTNSCGWAAPRICDSKICDSNGEYCKAPDPDHLRSRSMMG